MAQKKKIGFHMSISGGVFNAIGEALDLGIETFQIFLKNSNRWESPPLKEKDIEKFRSLWKSNANLSIHGHTGYLINFAGEGENLEKSMLLMAQEMNRADALGIPTLVLHPGNHKGAGIDTGIERISENLNRIFSENPGKVKILLETMAGQGTSIGHEFENLAAIIEKSDYKERLGVCLDTCHIFAAGYDFSNEKLYDELIINFDKTVGLKNLELIHLNDSKKQCGSRVDRHEHIGKGEIGERALGFFLRDERLHEVPFIMETPVEEDYGNRENLKVVLEMMGERSPGSGH